MANHKSALKRNRQNGKRRERNTANRSLAKSAAQKVTKAIATKGAEAGKDLVEATSLLAKAARKGAIPARRASRKISRLQKALNKTKQTNSGATT